MIVPPEDVIPKSTAFRYVKGSLVIVLFLLILMATVFILVAESLASKEGSGSSAMTIGIVSLVSVCLRLERVC